MKSLFSRLSRNRFILIYIVIVVLTLGVFQAISLRISQERRNQLDAQNNHPAPTLGQATVGKGGDQEKQTPTITPIIKEDTANMEKTIKDTLAAAFLKWDGWQTLSSRPDKVRDVRLSKRYDGSYECVVDINAENITETALKIYAINESTAVYITLYKNRTMNIGNTVVNTYGVVQDKYGYSRTKIIYTSSLPKSEADKINWGLESRELFSVARQLTKVY